MFSLARVSAVLATICVLSHQVDALYTQGPLAKRSQCASTLSAAEVCCLMALIPQRILDITLFFTYQGVATRIQSHWFDIITGEYSELWTDAVRPNTSHFTWPTILTRILMQNTLEDIHNLMLAAGTTTWDSLAAESYIGRIANLGLIPWSTVLDGSYDDAQVSSFSF